MPQIVTELPSAGAGECPGCMSALLNTSFLLQLLQIYRPQYKGWEARDFPRLRFWTCTRENKIPANSLKPTVWLDYPSRCWLPVHFSSAVWSQWIKQFPLLTITCIRVAFKPYLTQHITAVDICRLTQQRWLSLVVHGNPDFKIKLWIKHQAPTLNFLLHNTFSTSS